MSSFMGLRSKERSAIFIDGANLYKASRNLGFDIDYKNLLKRAREECLLLRASYYTAIQDERDQDFSRLRPLVDWLDYNGYSMVTKSTREFTDQQGRKRYKGSTDIELVVDMMSLQHRLDHVILFSGNGDFRRAVEALQSNGVRVSVVSTVKSSPQMASDELRRQADSFIDLADLEKVIGRSGNYENNRPNNNTTSDGDNFIEDYEEFDEFE